MRWNIIKNLFFTNLMYVNPMQTAKYRKKYKGTADIRKKIFNNLLLLNILNIVVFYILFGNSMFSSVLEGPSYKYILLFLIIMTALTLSTTFLNMFYESKDTHSLLPLPISEKELFIGKFLVLLFQLSGLFIPVIVINFIIAVNTEFSLIQIIISLIYSLCIIIIISGGLTLLLSTITYIPNFEKNKNKINGIIIIFGLLLGAGYVILSKELASNDLMLLQTKYRGDFFFDILTKESYANLLILIIITIVIAVLVNTLVAKKYLNDIHRIAGVHKTTLSSKQKEHKERSSKHTSLNAKLIKRNFNLFSHGTLLANIFSSYLLSIIIFAEAIIQIRREGGIQLGIEFYPFAICFGFSMALLMMYSPISFTGVAISLEKQDYYHLKSLPMDFKKYIKTKFIVSTFLQISLGIIMFMIMLILAGISIELFIITIFSYIITGIAIAFYSFTRDFNKLYLNWNNILELSTRGMSQILLGIIAFFCIIGLIILNTATIFLLLEYPNISHILGVIYAILIIVAITLTSMKAKKQVFDKIF